MRQSSRLLESNDPCEAISQLRLELSLVLLQENELEKQLEEKQIDLERKEEKIHTVQSEFEWSKDEIDQLKKALEKVKGKLLLTFRGTLRRNRRNWQRLKTQIGNLRRNTRSRRRI